MKVAIDGGPNIGKTTLIDMLAELGFVVVREQATVVIKSGGPMPWDDHVAFQYEVLRRQLAEEALVASEGLVFLDRSVYAARPYRQILGLPVPGFIQRLPKKAVDVAFILGPVPWQNDGVRYEDPEFTREVEPYFTETYEEMDVPVVHLSGDMTPEQRLTRILDEVGKAMGRNLTAVARKRGFTGNDERKAERRWFSIPSTGASTCFAPSLAMASAF